MKFSAMSPNLFIVALLLASASGSAINPLSKVISMISSFQNSIVKEGQEAQQVYTEFAEMCEERSRELHNEIKSSKATVGELSASIEKSAADDAVLDEKISDTAAGTSDSESELKRATELRTKEASDFGTEQAELLKTISTIERAITLIEREGAGASLAQLDSARSITQVLQTMAEAESINSDDAEKLTALVQSSSSEDDEETGARSATADQGASGQITETLEALLDKTQKQLEDARNTETGALNAFSLLKQSLDDKIKTMGREMTDAKKSKAATGESKATAEGNLEATKKDHTEDERSLAELHRECLDKATSFEEATNSRNEELKALAEAKKIITSTTGGAGGQTYAQVADTSFLQMASKTKAKSSTGAKSLHLVRRVAFKYHSDALIELANHIEKAIQFSDRSGASPFGKVKGMINSMINKLQKEAEADATKKAYCDKEMAETQSSKDDKEWALEKLATQVDVVSAQSKALKSEVARLEKELAALARTQAEMDKLRATEKANYAKNKPVLEQGLDGVKTALKVLRDYYAQDSGSDSGSASGIIGMLEVVESDFSKGVAELISSEESAQNEYTEATNENAVAKETKAQDAKYKTAEYVGLDKTIAELQSDASGVRSELDAVNDYFSSVKKECIAKPEPYAERKARREDEIAGLKEAMDTLAGDAVLLQRSTKHRTLRGAGRLTASD